MNLADQQDRQANDALGSAISGSQPTDAAFHATAAGPSRVPSIRLLSVGRSRWGAGTDRKHTHIYAALVALRTVSGGGRLFFRLDEGERELEFSGPAVVVFNDWYLDRIAGIEDHWCAHWYEFLADGDLVPPLLQPIDAPVTPLEEQRWKSIADGITSSELGERVHATASFAELLYGWFSQCHYGAEDQNIRAVDQAAAIIRDCVYDPVSVEDVATRVGVNPVKLRRLFREHLMMSPKQYYDRLRIEEARRLLEQGMLAKQVAKRLGFRSQHHFSKIFKEFVGLTCRDYRHRYCSQQR